MNRWYKNLTPHAKNELSALVIKKENALDMVANNFFDKQIYNASDITFRFQVQYFALNPDSKTLQEPDKNGWWQNEEFEANTINENVFPLFETSDAENDFWSKKYSSFALNREGGNYRINFPLKSDYNSSTLPFSKLDMAEESFAEFVNGISKSTNIEIVNQKSGVFNYKTSLFAYAIAKIKNSFLKLINKKTFNVFKGKMFVPAKSVGGYKYTNVEKVVKIYDQLISRALKRGTKQLKGKAKKAITKDVTLASKILANIYMCRITNFGNADLNKDAEKCLALQLSNVFNKNNFSSSELKIITATALKSVQMVCRQLNYTLEDVVEKLQQNGFVFDKDPKTFTEAFLLGQESDYTLYLEAIKATKKEREDKVESASLALPKREPASLALPKREPASLMAPKKEQALIAGAPEKMAIAGRAEQPKLNKGIHGLLTSAKAEYKYKKDLVDVVYKIIESKKVEPENEEVELQEAETSVEKSVVPASQDIVVENQDIAQRKLSRKTVANYIDKEIKKTLANQVLKITNAINANRCASFGGKIKAKKQAQILSMILAYYTKKTNGALKTTNATRKNSDTLYARSQQVTNVIFSLKESIVDKIIACSETDPIQKGERTVSYINRVAKNVCKGGDVEGMNIKDYFTKLIGSYASIYADGEFTDIHDKNK